MIGERICRINVIYQVTIYANPALLGGRSLGGIPGWRLPNNLRASRNRVGGKLKTVNYLRSKVKQQSELAFKTNNLFPSWDLQHPLDWRKHTVDHRRNLTLSANIWITNSSWHNPLGDPWSRLQTFSVSRGVEVSGPGTKRQRTTWSWQVSKNVECCFRRSTIFDKNHTITLCSIKNGYFFLVTSLKHRPQIT